MHVVDGIAYQRFGDTYVATLVDVGNMVFLNENAGLILEMLDQGNAEQDVIQEFCRRFQVDEEVAAQDIASVVAELADLGFVVRNNECPRAPVRQPVDENNDPRIAIRTYCEENCVPMIALIEVTYACNLRCRHCYIPFEDLHTIEEDHKRLQFDEYKKLLNDLRELGCYEVVFTGGEPATFSHLMGLCQYARSLRLSVSLKTNAALIDDPMISWLRRLHITEVQTSLYSMNPDIHDHITRRKGSWAATTTALRKMHAAGQRLRLACVAMQSNYKHLSGLRQFADSIDAPIGFDLVVQARTDGSRESVSERLLPSQLRWLEEQGILGKEVFLGGTPQVKPDDEVGYGLARYLQKDPDSRICGAGNTEVAIGPTGDILPCVSFNMRLGNVQTEQLRQVLSNEATNRLRSYRNRSFEACKGCEIEEYCPRCMATNYLESGHPLSRVQSVCEAAYWYAKHGGASPEVLRTWSRHYNIVPEGSQQVG